MENQQLSMFKGWFIEAYPDCRDYLDLTYFDAEKNTFLSKCSYNPDSGNAAKVLRIAFGSWQHLQAKVEELQKQVDSLTQTMEELLEEMKYPTATFEEVIVCGVKELAQALKGEWND